MPRRQLSTSLSLVLTASAAMTALTGCLEHPVKEVEYDQVTVLEPVTLIEPNRDVDVLFVIDNSGSMAEEQGLLAQNFDAFFGELVLVDANYRIGIVTTDNGNPRDPKAVFDSGDLRLSSCLGRVEDGEFVYNDFDAAFACTDHCTLSDGDLEIRPTTADSSGDPDKEVAPRSWLERLYSETNLGGGVSIAQAFQCYGPQGVNGAGFESPLESMYGALVKSGDRDSGNYGFLRDNAHLAVVFITDEVDCSFNPDFAEIFRDNTTFWSDPDGPIPTSAVCWNAGTQCEGPGPVYEGCDSADYDSMGQPTTSGDDAVIFPIDRYVAFLDGIREAKRDGTKVMVAALAGVPQGFADGAAPIPYADAVDPAEQGEFGVGAGCTFNLEDDDPSNDSVARPPYACGSSRRPSRSIRRASTLGSTRSARTTTPRRCATSPSRSGPSSRRAASPRASRTRTPRPSSSSRTVRCTRRTAWAMIVRTSSPVSTSTGSGGRPRGRGSVTRSSPTRAGRPQTSRTT